MTHPLVFIKKTSKSEAFMDAVRYLLGQMEGGTY